MDLDRRGIALLASLVSIALVGCRAEGPGPWARFHGPGGQGISSETGLPVTWSADGDGIRWKSEVPGVGNSSPIVQSGRVYLTTAIEEEERTASGLKQIRRVVLAYDLATGKRLWQTNLFIAPAESKHRWNTFAAPSPVIDGEHVFVFFGSVLASLDVDGKVVWQREVDPRFLADSHYGAASSPVLSSDNVIVFQDREVVADDQEGWLAAFAKDTGEEQWRVRWSNSCCAYSTPLVVDRGSGEEVYVAHSGSIASYLAATGEELWRSSVPINQIVSSPVLSGDLLGISGGAHNVRHTVFLRLTGSGAETSREVLWKDPHQAPNTSSPVLYNGLFFAVTDQGIVTCWDAETGELYWRERLEQHHNRASLVAGDGKIYVPSTWGRTSVLAADKKFKLLAQNDLDGTASNASPAIADGCLLLRTGAALYCIEGRGEGLPDTATGQGTDDPAT